MIECLCSLLPLVASSIIGPVVVGVIGGFIFVICCIAGIVIIKHRKSRNQISNSQQVELRSTGTIQPNTASHPLAQQPPPSYPQQPPTLYTQRPPPSYPQQLPGQYPYLVTPVGNTVYPNQEINMEPKTLTVPPPPNYDDLYRNWYTYKANQ